MSYFLDTSALGKIYHAEKGSAWMRSVYEGPDSVYISELAIVEFTSMCARYVRERSFTPEELRTVTAALEDDTVLRFGLLRFTPEILSGAVKLLSTEGLGLPLRSLDALQFSFLRKCPDQAAVFISSDRRLVELAQRIGVAVINPELM